MTDPSLPRIALIGNIANVGYSYAKFLNMRGVQATLVPADVEWNSNAPDHTARTDSPINEDTAPLLSALGPCYSTTLSGRIARRLFFKLGMPAATDVYRLLRNAQLIQAHTATAIWAAAVKRKAGVPFIAVTTGADITELAFEDSLDGRAYRRALQDADLVLLSNTGQWTYAEQLGLDLSRVAFVPFALDADRYSPSTTVSNNDEVLFFSVSRLDWSETGRKSTKRNDLFIRAFARYRNDHPESRMRLRIADWGIDRQKTRELVAELGLVDDVEFVNTGDKDHLIRLYREADVVVDQFAIGSAGLSCLEAMSVGKPVFIYWSQQGSSRCYSEAPPVVNCANENEIYQGITAMMDEQKRTDLGVRARQWILQNHHWPAVTDRLIAHYDAIMRRPALVAS